MEWILFTLRGREILAITVEGTFKGEIRATKELLAYERGCKPESITTRLEVR